MPTPTAIVLRSRSLAPGLIAACIALSSFACDDATEPPPPPTGIAILSGDAQYSKKGTLLDEPVVVKLTLEGGDPAADVEVRFKVIEGGGTLSRAGAMTSGAGKTSVQWTLGPGVGANRLQVTQADNSSLSVIATATSSDFYCPEEDPVFARKFTAAHDLFVVTRSAGVLESNGVPGAGVVQIALDFGNQQFAATAFSHFPETTSQQVLRDCAFAASGDFFVTRNSVGNDVVKVNPDASLAHFAVQESSFGSEIEATSVGLLVGCDAFGPFAVSCRDTLSRWDNSVTYSGNYPDAASNEAVATNPANDDLYFIYLGDRWIWRLPLDGLALEGPAERVAQLTRPEADGARGMVVDEGDGSIYILVESSTVKGILKVTSAGVKTTEVDFFSRGAGDAAGVQSDLAIDRAFNFLYTLDTKNNVILLYQLVPQQLSELTSSGDPNALSNASSGERVGIAVLP